MSTGIRIGIGLAALTLMASTHLLLLQSPAGAQSAGLPSISIVADSDCVVGGQSAGFTLKSDRTLKTGLTVKLSFGRNYRVIDDWYLENYKSETLQAGIDSKRFSITTRHPGADGSNWSKSSLPNYTYLQGEHGSFTVALVPNSSKYSIKGSSATVRVYHPDQRDACREPTPTNTPTATPTHTPTATPTHTPTATPTHTPTATPTHTPTATPANAPTATPTHTPTATPTHTPTATPDNQPRGSSDQPSLPPPTPTPNTTSSNRNAQAPSAPEPPRRERTPTATFTPESDPWAKLPATSTPTSTPSSTPTPTTGRTQIVTPTIPDHAATATPTAIPTTVADAPDTTAAATPTQEPESKPVNTPTPEAEPVAMSTTSEHCGVRLAIAHATIRVGDSTMLTASHPGTTGWGITFNNGGLALGEPVHESPERTTWRVVATQTGAATVTIVAKCRDGREIGFTATIHVDPVIMATSIVAAEPSTVPDVEETTSIVVHEPTPAIAAIEAVPSATAAPGPVPVTATTTIADVQTPTRTPTPTPASSPEIREDEAVVMVNPEGAGPGSASTEPPPSDQDASTGTSWWISLWILLAATAVVLLYLILIRRRRRESSVDAVEDETVFVEETIVDDDHEDVGDRLVIDRISG